MESFYSIQGEGYHAGKPTYFIRLAGCDVGCHWCDVKESWKVEDHERASIKDLVEAIPGNDGIVVVTGGEPLMHKLDDLTLCLRKMGGKTHLETSGAYPLSGSWDWICISPKKFKPVLEENLIFANELKVVIYHPSDLKWAESFRGKLSPDCKLFLQPEWSKREKMIPLINGYCKENPEWRISLQIHNYMGVP